jgi:hypothetical protein
VKGRRREARPGAPPSTGADLEALARAFVAGEDVDVAATLGPGPAPPRPHRAKQAALRPSPVLAMRLTPSAAKG